MKEVTLTIQVEQELWDRLMTGERRYIEPFTYEAENKLATALDIYMAEAIKEEK